MIAETIFGIFGGLGIFIFGIRMMSEGLKKVAGEKMRNVLGILTKNRFSGLLFGTAVTSVVQSSSATTVMVIGFVNAGLMTLVQAIPIVMGANIGTTITAQLVAFKITQYAIPIAGLGGFMYLFAKKRQTKQLGETVFGFGLLFLGLSILTDAVRVLGSGSAIENAFMTFSANPFLGIIVGMIATEIVQSSSITTSILVALSATGLIDFPSALPVILGINIGTTITALIASIGTTITAKRSAWSHIFFNIMGTIIAIFMIPLYIKFIPLTAVESARQIANAHTVFNIFNALVFIWFVPLIAKIIKKIVPGEELIIDHGPKFLDKNLLSTPSIAIDASRKEIIGMLKITKEMYLTTMKVFNNNNQKEIKQIEASEDIVDELRDSITNYLVKVTETEITKKEAMMIPGLLHTVNDIERIGDHAENMSQLALRKIEKKLLFRDESLKELKEMEMITNKMFEEIVVAFENLDKKLTKSVLRREKELNKAYLGNRDKHAKRITSTSISSLSGIVYLDMLANFEKIGDLITNIAQAIEGKLQWEDDGVY